MLPALPQVAGAMAALGFVLLLIVLAARGGRLLPALRASQGNALIRLHGTLALDTRRRLHLVEAGGRQALILTGGSQDMLLAWPRDSERSLPGAP